MDYTDVGEGLTEPVWNFVKGILFNVAYDVTRALHAPLEFLLILTIINVAFISASLIDSLNHGLAFISGQALTTLILASAGFFVGESIVAIALAVIVYLVKPLLDRY